MSRRQLHGSGRVIDPLSAEGRVIAAKIKERETHAKGLAARTKEKPLRGEKLLVEAPEKDDEARTVGLEKTTAEATTTTSLDHIKDFKKWLVLYFALKGNYRLTKKQLKNLEKKRNKYNT